VTAPLLPSPLEVQHRVVQAIGRSTYLWPPSQLLPMLPYAGTEKNCEFMSFRCVLFSFVMMSIFSELVFPD
jgi:hypothetical protein